MSAPEKHPFPTFDYDLPQSAHEASVIHEAETIVKGALAGFVQYARYAPGYELGIRGEVCEALMMADEGIEAEAYGVGSELGNDRIRFLIQERHRADPAFSEMRARCIGAYRDWFLGCCLMNDFSYGAAIQGWEELVVEDPMGVMEQALNLAQKRIEKQQ